MSFVDRELKRVQLALDGLDLNSERARSLMIAQQALAWALEPTCFASPLVTVDRWFPSDPTCSP